MSNSGKLTLVGKRTEHPIQLLINGRLLNRVIIDSHYKEKHAESVNDELILALVKELHGGNYPIEMTKDEFEYFAVEPVFNAGKPFRIVLVLCIGEDYLGVVNAFRVNGG